MQVTAIPTYSTARKKMLSQALACGAWEQTHTFADGTTRTAFMTSPRMSTYLLAFVVGEFDHARRRRGRLDARVRAAGRRLDARRGGGF